MDTRPPRPAGSAWSTALRTPMGVTAAIAVLVVVLLAVAAPWIWGDEASALDTKAINQGPSSEHLLGTDQLGRDIFFRTLVATRLSVGLAILATLMSAVTGTIVGMLPTILPPRAGRLLSVTVDVAVAFPGLLLALFFATIFGVGTRGSVLAIGLAGVPWFARLTLTLAASVAGRDFVAAAKVAGVGRLRIVRRHILPNIAEPLVISATLGAGTALLAFAGLSFLGIGVQAPSYDWGRLLSEGLLRIYVNPAAAIGPAVAILIAGLAFNLLGETAAAVIGKRAGSQMPDSAVPESSAPVTGEPEEASDAEVLRVRDLRVHFPSNSSWSSPVRGVSLDLHRGESLGVVGESGSGKSLTALAIARLLEHPAVVSADELTFEGEPTLELGPRQLRAQLGTSLAMVFQDPLSSFNPTRRVGRQLAEVAEVHAGLSRRSALSRAVDRLRMVRVPAPERRAARFPHEFSGGMRQRAMIALGLMGEPKLIIADEPTTALDVTVQRQILDLLSDVREQTGAAVLLISHDIGVVSYSCDRVLVMYAGRVVESLPTLGMDASARHPYTRALLGAVPALDVDRAQDLAVIPGRPPDPADLPNGCAFADRCPRATAACRREDPLLVSIGSRHQVACWHPMDPIQVADSAPISDCGLVPATGDVHE